MLLFLEIFIAINIFIIGTLFGSFLSLATYRLPRKQDILVKRSYCPNCKHELGFFDLIPVLSYIFHFGKCKYCKDKISPRYILFEIFNGIFFLICYLLFKFSLEIYIILVVYIIAFLIIGSYIMAKKMDSSEVISKTSSKKGVFISELVIAMILFTIFVASTYITSRNYNNKLEIEVLKADAFKVGVMAMEQALATQYDDLISSKSISNTFNQKMQIETNVSRYSDESESLKDVIKIVEVKVYYELDSKEQVVKLNSLKTRNYEGSDDDE